MVGKRLSESRRRAGEELIAALDAAGFHPEHVFWTYRRSDGDWRLRIVSTLADRMGASAVFQGLMLLRPKIAWPKGVDLLDLAVQGTKDHEPSLVLHAPEFATGGEFSVPTGYGDTIDVFPLRLAHRAGRREFERRLEALSRGKRRLPRAA